MSLASFVHISDLHIGDVDDESLSARTLCWKRWPWFTGLLGHSGDSLMDLDDFFSDLRLDHPDARLIMTGDLTAMGAPQEFDTANQYLGGILRSPLGDRLGLEVLDWGDRAIPGNHDHWPGQPIVVGRPTRALRRYFPALPKIQPASDLGKGRQLRLLRIDTDADVKAFSTERMRAFGSFKSQLQTVSAELEAFGPNDTEIRVLCLHHSPSYRGAILEITPDSRTALHTFLAQNRVAVTLCGHIHRPPWAKPYSLPGLNLDIFEVCCGTTTQIDPTIARRRELEGSVHTQWQNSLFVHRLLDVHGDIHWEAELYLEGRAGFVPADRLRDDIPTVSKFKVWPWPPQAV